MQDGGRRHGAGIDEAARADRGVVQGSGAVLRSAGAGRPRPTRPEEPAPTGTCLPLRHPPGTVRRRTRHRTRSLLSATHHGKHDRLQVNATAYRLLSAAIGVQNKESTTSLKLVAGTSLRQITITLAANPNFVCIETTRCSSPEINIQQVTCRVTTTTASFDSGRVLHNSNASDFRSKVRVFIA